MAKMFCRTVVLLSVVAAGGVVGREASAEGEPGQQPKAAFFVATDGNDAWSGTLAAPNAEKTDGPFATLAKAHDAVREVKAKQKGPITVMIRGGKYFLDRPVVFGPEDSGTVESPISYSAYPVEKPIISGGRVITGWKPYKDKIVQCSIQGAGGGKWKFRRLLYNGKPQTRARTPNFDPKNPYNGGWAPVVGAGKPGSQSAFTYKPGTFKHHWVKPGEAEVNVFVGHGSGWLNNIIRIKAIDEQNHVITLAHDTKRFMKPGMAYDYGPNPFRKGNRFIVENLLEELDQPGEWCWDSQAGTLYFWPPDGSAQPADVVVPRLDCLVALHGTKYVTICGLTFTATSGGDNFHPHGVEGTGAMFPEPEWKYCGQAVYLNGAEHCRVEDNHFHAVGGNAVYLEGHNLRNLIRRNEIGDVGACGVGLAGSKNEYPVFNQIVDNHIHHTGAINTYSAGVFAGLSEGNVIGHNSIHHVPHHAVNLGDSSLSRNIVEYNEIRHTCLQNYDTGAINSWMEIGDQAGLRQGHIIRYNLVADSRERGIYLDDYTSNCFVYGNLVVRARTVGVVVHAGKNNVIENNVIVHTGAATAYYDCISSLMPHMAGFISGNRFCRNIVYDTKKVRQVHLYKHKWPERIMAQADYNVFFSAADAESYLKAMRQTGCETHSLVADPMFVDPAKDDYRLKPESPALKLGFQPIDFSKIGIRKKQE